MASEREAFQRRSRKRDVAFSLKVRKPAHGVADFSRAANGGLGSFADIGTGFVRGRADGSSSPTAGPSEMRFAKFENGRDLLSTRRGPRGSGAGARASHPSRAAVLPPIRAVGVSSWNYVKVRWGVSCLTPVKPFSNDCPWQRARNPSATAICRARRLPCASR